jgi:hypothetical protein
MASSGKPRQLLDLPDELLASILGNLDFDSLLEVVLVCKHLGDLADPFLYHNIEILTGEQGAGLSYSLLERPSRAKRIRSFLVSTKLGETDGLAQLPPLISRMSNLQELRLETPDCNKEEPADRVPWLNLQNRYERVFEGGSILFPDRARRYLPNLQSCTIHFVDESKEIYSMTKYSALFMHPTLKDLTISCASTDRPENLFKPFLEDTTLVKSTELESLHLEECDILPETLAILLSLPRELKSLKISEGIRYDHFGGGNSRAHGNACPGRLCDAIAEHCAGSLQSLSLALGFIRSRTFPINNYGQHLDLTRFENLKYLEVDHRTFYLTRPQPTCDHATWRRLPESLETFKVFALPMHHPLNVRNRESTRASFPFNICFVRDKAKHGVPKLKTLICSYDYHKSDDIHTLVLSDEGETIQSLSPVSLAKSRIVKDATSILPVLKKADIKLELEITALPNGFIPPFLYPEDRPHTETLWVSPR